MSSDETPRMMVDRALRDFRESNSSDDRLKSLWKISQLVEDTTDDELYEVAQAIVAEDDYRLRGEICYTIERSRRPDLIKFVRNMTQDNNQYVRRQAITAISELDGANEATLAAIEPLLSVVNELKSAMVGIEKKISSIQNSNRGSSDSMPQISAKDMIVIDDRMRSWETYLRHERELLQDHKGKYVAIYKGNIIAIDESDERLARMLQDVYGEVEALICKIEESDEEPIQIPYDRNIVEI